jgi:hypothetical protein
MTSGCYKFGNGVLVGLGRGCGQPTGQCGRGVGVCLVCAETTAAMPIAAINDSRQKINLIPAEISTGNRIKVSSPIGGNTPPILSDI